MSNAIVTWASGEQFCKSPEFSVYIQSAMSIDVERVIYTTETEPLMDYKTIRDNFNIIKVHNCHNLMRDRNYFFWQFCLSSQNERVLICDSKDVIFQRDPFEYSSKEEIFLVEEGMLHKESPWNINEQKQVQAGLKENFIPFRDNAVVNAGVYLGRPIDLKHLFLLIWTNAIRTSACTDQAVLNYLVNHLKKDPVYNFVNPLSDDFCLTGEAVKEGFVKVGFENGKFLNSKTGNPYFLVHQWDRTEFREQILAQYSI